MNRDFVNHSKPRVSDHVFVEDREREGKNGLGYVVSLDYESQQVMVIFFGDGHQVCAVRGNASSCIHCIHTIPSWFNGGGDVEEYSFEQFEGCWSTHTDGIEPVYSGTWII